MHAVTNSDDTESVTARLRAMREIEADREQVKGTHLGDLLREITGHADPLMELAKGFLPLAGTVDGLYKVLRIAYVNGQIDLMKADNAKLSAEINAFKRGAK